MRIHTYMYIYIYISLTYIHIHMIAPVRSLFYRGAWNHDFLPRRVLGEAYPQLENLWTAFYGWMEVPS